MLCLSGKARSADYRPVGKQPIASHITCLHSFETSYVDLEFGLSGRMLAAQVRRCKKYTECRRFVG